MITTKAMPVRRKIKTTFLVFMFLITAVMHPVVAESPMEKAKVVKKQISSMKSDLNAAFNRYEQDKTKLEKIKMRLADNKIKLKKTKRKLNNSQKVLGKRVNNMYRYGDATLLDIIFSARSFNEMLVNINFITRIGKEDARIITEVRELKEKVISTQKQLVADKKDQEKTVVAQKEKSEYIEGKLGKAKRLLKGLEKEIAELNKPKPLPKPVALQLTPVTSPENPPPVQVTNSSYAFPVNSPYSYSNDWGQPRGGGTRTHKGTDILAPAGTPTVAVIGGTVSNTEGRSAGKWQILNGDDGNVYWYMHQSGFAASGRVEKGQVIGYVGNSGNAAGGPAHCHFEVHPGGGPATNPYYFLSSIG